MDVTAGLMWFSLAAACLGCAGAGAVGGPIAVDRAPSGGDRPGAGPAGALQIAGDPASGGDPAGASGAAATAAVAGGDPEPPLQPTIAVAPGEKLVDVPSGVIRSGCPRERRAICLGRKVQAFRVQRRFTTVEVYEACVRSGVCAAAPKAQGAGEAVHDVAWADAQRSCLSRGMRLPTEAEWERAREEGAIDVGPSEPTEWLLGWYSFFREGFRGEDVGVKGLGNARLVIRLEAGQSYRYGVLHIPPGGTKPPLAFRCVAGPPPEVPRTRCVFTGVSVDCKDE